METDSAYFYSYRGKIQAESHERLYLQEKRRRRKFTHVEGA
jgi:hypothetical protein